MLIDFNDFYDDFYDWTKLRQYGRAKAMSLNKGVLYYIRT